LKNLRVSKYLPDTISKITLTNLYGRKVALLAYNDILQNSEGLGYLLARELTDVDLQVKINYGRTQKTMDQFMEIENMAREKEKNDRIIVLRLKDMGKIPGSIVKDIQEYKNSNGAENVLINIFIQPSVEKDGEARFDKYTTLALKEIIKKEMISM